MEGHPLEERPCVLKSEGDLYGIVVFSTYVKYPASCLTRFTRFMAFGNFRNYGFCILHLRHIVMSVGFREFLRA